MISCILCTARDDFPIIGMRELHLFQPTIKSLVNQTFKDFELIIVDALSRDHDFSKLPFPVKHVPVHPNHRFWLDHKRWNVAGALNTGILHAEGDLLVRIDDCSEFSEDFLEKFWTGYQSGYFPLAMHTRFRDGRQAYYTEDYRQQGYEFTREAREDKEERERILSTVFKEGAPVRDTRWPVVEARGGRMIAPSQWYYGYSSMSLDAALKVNGYNELFDGDKGQEDQEMGLRLSMAGYSNLFLLDVRHSVIEHEHLPIPEDVIARDTGNIKCNYSIYLLNQRKGRWRANSERLSEAEIEFIRQESLTPPCSPRLNFYLDDCRGPLFDLWLNHQNLFDLREERMSL
jgi:glycosyltransferase involved in cell wall biosynthesis